VEALDWVFYLALDGMACGRGVAEGLFSFQKILQIFSDLCHIESLDACMEY